MEKLWKLKITHYDNSFRAGHKEESYEIEGYIKKEQIAYRYREYDKRTKIEEKTFIYIIPNTVVISHSCDSFSKTDIDCINNWTIKFQVNEEEKKLKPVEIIDITCDHEEYDWMEDSTKHIKMDYKNGSYYYSYYIPCCEECEEYVREENPEEARKLIEKYVKENIYFDIEPVEELSAIQQK